MKTDFFYLQNVAVTKSYYIDNNKSCIAFIPGFPGRKRDSRSNFETWDISLCKELSKNADFISIRYSGTGKSLGNLTLWQTVLDTKLFIEYLNNTYSNISIISFSWGALTTSLSLQLITDNKLKQLIFLAPLYHINTTDNLSHICEIIKQEREEFLSSYSLDDMVNDALKIRELLNLESFIKLYSKQNFNIFHGIKDEDIPVYNSQYLVQKCVNANLKLYDTDHFFGDREQVIFDINSILNK